MIGDNKIKKCHLCNSAHGFTGHRDGTSRISEVNCEKCGHYTVTNECLGALHDRAEYSGKIHVLSALSRELTECGLGPIHLTEKHLDDHLKHHLIPDLSSPQAKAGKLIQAIKRSSAHFGENVEVDFDRDCPLAYAQNIREFCSLVFFLEQDGLIYKQVGSSNDARIELTAKGWNLAKELGASNVDSKQAFIAIWFDPQMDDSIKAIEKAVEEAGFHPMCIKEKNYPERIMDKALAEIRRSRFIVADVTGQRPSVFFELGFAYGLGLEIIYIAQKPDDDEDSEFEFYVGHYKVIEYDHPADIGEKLKDAIGARNL